ncbi:MAG: proline dehydrogenase [Bacteroidetes bacterium]|nr:MAG: proline dehydrogenase [Bacteroidota bacterium]
MNPTPDFSFNNTEIAFQDKSNSDLKKARLLFSTFNYKWLLKVGPSLARFGLRSGLPVKGLIKDTIFAQFCGGESIRDCAETIERLNHAKIGTILDYSVEGQELETTFDHTCEEIIQTIEKAAEARDSIPFSVFKVTGIAAFNVLKNAAKGAEQLSGKEAEAFERVQARFDKITQKAYERKVRLFIDAEETWIQDTIDRMTEVAAEKFNKEEAIIYNTLQMYRHDRLAYLQQMIDKANQGNYKLGFKLVRGAYMEKERLRAAKLGYPSPIQKDKASSDRDFDAALRLSLSHADTVSICAGTHNEQSCKLLTELMAEKSMHASDKRVYFAQLLGMSDHISYNLAHAGYNVAKYVPYGPVKEVLPYLTRRAEENSSVAGQAGRELSLIEKELKRRTTSS